MGKFITFEGGEGCGKSTLIQGLKDYFDKHLSTLEIVSKIQSVLIDSKKDDKDTD